MLQKITGLIGILVFLLIAWLFSSHKKSVNYKTVVVALFFEFIIGLAIFRFPQSREILLAFSNFFTKILEAAREGIVFVFGALGSANSDWGFILFFQSLTYIIIFASLCSLLYYLRVLPFIIVSIAKFVKKFFGISAVEAICSASNMFVGIESFASIRPYFHSLTRSQIFLIFTVFMSTIASSVMALYISFLSDKIPTIAGHLVSATVLSIPAAIMVAKIMEPETETPEASEMKIEIPESAKTFTGSIVNGAMDGGKMVFGIAVLLVAVIGILGIINLCLSYFTDVTISGILGQIFKPVALLMGITPNDAALVGELLGTRLIMTEVPSYIGLSEAMNAGTISPHSAIAASYALCGFTSIESLSIAIGASIALVPEKTDLITSVCYKSLFAATIATVITGTVAGLFYIG
ncbi:MAG: hypothetical protein K6C94_02490 [Candidatus Gastranaerophilales bacterium]|nr:hypothetical protein [Candidatus Gastranaerophilales bacterium]